MQILSTAELYIMTRKDMFGGRKRPFRVCRASKCRPRPRKADQRTFHRPDSPQMPPVKSVTNAIVQY